MRVAGPLSRGRLSLALVAAVTLVLFALTPLPHAPDPDPGAAGAKFIGAAKCANCHKSDAGGDQYGKWKETAHSHAFEVLASDKAKEVGKSKGVDDPQQSELCLKCHVTAFGKPAEELAKGFDPALGVQCESCHGAGENHMKARISAAAKAKGGEVAPVTADEIVGQPTIDNCIQCHNEQSPTAKPFCFRMHNAKIVHPIPGKKHSPEEEKLLTSGCGCAECKCANGDAAECAGGGG
jgi:hypothetical protein